MKTYLIRKVSEFNRKHSTSCILRTSASYSEIAIRFKYDDSIKYDDTSTSRILYFIRELRPPNKSWKIWDDSKKFTSIEEAYEYLSNFEFVDYATTLEKSLEYIGSIYIDLFKNESVDFNDKVYNGNDITFCHASESCPLEEFLKCHGLNPKRSIYGVLYVWDRLIIDKPGIYKRNLETVLEAVDIYKTVEHVKVTEIRYK